MFGKYLVSHNYSFSIAAPVPRRSGGCRRTSIASVKAMPLLIRSSVGLAPPLFGIVQPALLAVRARNDRWLKARLPAGGRQLNIRIGVGIALIYDRQRQEIE